FLRSLAPTLFPYTTLFRSLYIADTGDNAMARKSVVIYAMAEPGPPDRQGGAVRSAPAAALRLKYVGGPDDVEAIYVSPRDSALRSEEHTSELQSRGHLVCR